MRNDEMINRKRPGSNQKGFSTIAIIIIVGIASMLLLAFFRVFPMWMENVRLQSALEGVAQDQTVDARSKRDIWESLQKRMYVGDVRSVKRENVTISRKDGKTTVLVEYETRAGFIANYFIGADFQTQVVIDR